MIRNKLLKWIGRVTHRHWLVILVLTAITVVLCVFAVRSLKITTGYVDMLPQEHAAVKNYFNVLDKFGGTDYFLVVVEAPDTEMVHEVTDVLADRLAATGDFDYIQYRADLEQFTRYGLLYLDIDTLKEIDLLLSERNFDELTKLARSFTGLQSDLSESLGAGLKVDDDGYFTSADGTAGLLIARPTFGSGDSDAIAPFGTRMEKLTDSMEEENPGSRLWVSGSYQYEYEQRNVLNRDMLIVGSLALLAIFIILAIAFKSIATPLVAMIALGCGMMWTLGLARATVKSLNTVSSIFVIVLMGIGIEYGIALLSRYREERGRGAGSADAFTGALTRTGQGVITGALTTAGAFFALAFSDFKAMRDMGIVLGLGVMCALLSMFFVLPAMIRLKERFFPYHASGVPPESKTMRRLGGAISGHAVGFVTAGLLVTVGLGVSAGFIGFESNIRKIQPRGMEVTRAEEKLNKEFGKVSDFLIVVSSNEAAMREATEDLAGLDSVRAVESLATIIPSDQLAKLVVMSRIKKKVENLNPEWLGYVPPEMLQVLEDIGSDTLTIDKLPPDSRDKYVSDDGFYATYVYPEKDIFVEKNAVEFLDDVRSVSTDIAGMPMIIQDSIESTRNGLSETTLLSAIAVMLMVVIDFQALVPTLLALLPLMLSMLWMMGAINMLGMNFNLVNIAGAPIILGIGVDFGVYILHRYKEEHKVEGETIPAVLAHTGRAIVVSGLAVIAAFSALIFARYQGLASLGIVAAVGIAFAAISAVTVLPAILRLLERYRKKGRAF